MSKQITIDGVDYVPALSHSLIGTGTGNGDGDGYSDGYGDGTGYGW